MKSLYQLKNSFFAQLIFTFSIFAAIMVVLVGVVLFNKANDFTIQEISKDIGFQLEKSRDFTESSILKSYEDALLNKVVATVNPGSTDEIAYFLDHSRRGNMYRITQLVKDLKTVTMANEGTYNITIHFLKENFVVNSNFFIETPDNSNDRNYINHQLEQTKPEQWFAREGVTDDHRTVDLLTIVYTLPFKAQGDRIKGYMYIDVDKSFMKQSLQKMLNSSEEVLYVYDQQKKLILSTSTPDQQDTDFIANLIQNNHVGVEVQKSKNDNRVFANLSPGLSIGGWTYVVVKPIDSFLLASHQLKRDILITCLIVLAIGLFISYLISRRFDLPMRRLILNIRNLYGNSMPSQPMNGYAIIDNALDTQNRKIAVMKEQLKLKQITDLITGNLSEIYEYPDAIGDYCYYVVYVRLFGEISQDFKNRFQKIKHMMNCEVTVLNTNQVVILYRSHQRAEDYVPLIREDFRKFHLFANGALAYEAGIGSPVHTLEQIQESYQQALQAQRYSFLFGRETVIAFDEIENRSQLIHGISIETFAILIKSGETEGIERFFDNFARTMKDKPLAIEAIELVLMQVHTTLSQTVVELNLENKFHFSSELFAEFKKKSFDETVAWLRDLSVQAANYIRECSNHTHADIMNMLKQYIDEHYDEDISLDILARIADYSPQYISTLFREVLNVSFSDYLTQLRLAKAAELLHRQSLSIKDISIKVGYRNVQYFSTRFKARYGVTPVQYRNAHS